VKGASQAFVKEQKEQGDLNARELLELLRRGVEMLQSLFETEVLEIVGAQLVAQQSGELLLLL
jgi:hypothetical protein